jgi:hypothetical protein
MEVQSYIKSGAYTRTVLLLPTLSHLLLIRTFNFSVSIFSWSNVTQTRIS